MRKFFTNQWVVGSFASAWALSVLRQSVVAALIAGLLALFVFPSTRAWLLTKLKLNLSKKMKWAVVIVLMLLEVSAAPSLASPTAGLLTPSPSSHASVQPSSKPESAAPTPSPTPSVSLLPSPSATPSPTAQITAASPLPSSLPSPSPTPSPSPKQTIYPSPVVKAVVASPTPTLRISATVKPSLVTQPSPSVSSGLSNDNHYTNVDGNSVHSPAYSNTIPSGATAKCKDGAYSFSQHRSGTCSGHGGVASWL
jgi:hypothetical protein